MFIDIKFIILFLLFATTESFSFGRREEGVCQFASSSCSLYEQKKLSSEEIEDLLIHQLQDRVISIRHFLNTQLQVFRDFFLKALRNSHLELDIMFTETYGSFYSDNVEILNEFFEKVKSFSLGHSEVTMKSIIEIFFNKLFRTMFTISNPFQVISSETWKCMESFSSEIRVFDNLPNRIINQLNTPLSNLKNFMGAIETLSNILDGYLNITLKEECKRGLTRMDACSKCIGVQEKPCNQFCINILSGCVYQMMDSETTWLHAIDTLTKVAHELQRHQNFVSSMQPIPILISEAIMYFQEKKDYITNKMISKCLYKYQDSFLKTKRSAMKLKREKKEYSTQKESRDYLILDQIFDSFNVKINQFKPLFENLPVKLCELDYWASSDERRCWNGTSIGEYRLGIVQKQNLVKNPEYQKENFLTFRGSYVEERLRMQWLHTRLSNILKRRQNIEFYSAQAYVGRDDEDYKNEDYEGSGDYFTMIQNSKHASRDRIEIVVEPYHAEMNNCKNVSFLILFFLIFLYF